MILARRSFIRAGLLAGIATTLPAPLLAAAAPARARAGWLDREAPGLSLGTTFGVPWPMGQVSDATKLAAGDVAVQSWPLAWWPDGSVKWSAHALAPDARPDALHIAPGRAARHRSPVRVSETTDAVRVSTGAATWIVAKRGDTLIRSATVGERQAVGAVRLVASVARDADGTGNVPLTGQVERVTVEQSGPVRAVLKIEGAHVGGGRRLFPFVVRLYAYAGAGSLRIMHSFVHDGVAGQDFLTSLGLRADMPMGDTAPHDRHVRVALGNDRIFAEAVRPLTGLRRDTGEAFRKAQVAGKATPPLSQMTPRIAALLHRIPNWTDFRLDQANANGATLMKRTGEGHAWIDSDETTRAEGLAYVGTPTHGVALGQRWFWQRHPTALDIANAAVDTASVTAWLYSPRAPAMDLRSYRGVDGMERFDAQNEGLAITYEDYEPGWDDARGIGRTNELTLWALPGTPSADDFLAMARANAEPPLMVVAPEHAVATKVLGIWGLPDRSTPARARIEAQLSELTDFYAGEVDRRSWYGFWDHGDVMHSYDADRHQWRYDIGGFAWDNSELSPDLWLWYQALRTADPKSWRLAEAMTRHTGEVDVYHLGRFKGMGTRHGVQHFSDSSKQPRVSNAAYRRIFYYLTADERVGDLMRDLTVSGETLRDVVIERKVPGRNASELPEGTVNMSFGTVWCSLAAAWLTEWERTRDPRWRDRLAAGMETIGAMPTGWFAGGAPYDLATGRFRDPGARISLSHLNAVFGAVEVNAELLQLIDVPAYRRTWLDYCRWYNAPAAAFEAKWGQRKGATNLKQGHSRLTAFAASMSHDVELATRASAEFYSGEAGLDTVARDPRVTLADGVVEWPGVSTNGAAQWGLAAIQTLALIPDALDRGRG